MSSPARGVVHNLYTELSRSAQLARANIGLQPASCLQWQQIGGPGDAMAGYSAQLHWQPWLSYRTCSASARIGAGGGACRALCALVLGDNGVSIACLWPVWCLLTAHNVYYARFRQATMAGNRVQWRHVRGGRRRPCPPSPAAESRSARRGEEQVPWPPSSLQGHAPGLFGKGLLVWRVVVMAVHYAPLLPQRTYSVVSGLWRGGGLSFMPESVFMQRAFGATAQFQVVGATHAIGAMAADGFKGCFARSVFQFAVWPPFGWRKMMFPRLFCFLFHLEYLCPCPCLWTHNWGKNALLCRVRSLWKSFASGNGAERTGPVAPEGAIYAIALKVVVAGHVGDVGGRGHALAGAEGVDGFEGGHGVTPLPFSWA